MFCIVLRQIANIKENKKNVLYWRKESNSVGYKQKAENKICIYINKLIKMSLDFKSPSVHCKLRNRN